MLSLGYPKDVLGDTQKYKANDILDETKVVDRSALEKRTVQAPRDSEAPVTTPKLQKATEAPAHDGVLFGPDGMPLQDDAPVEEDEEGHLHAKLAAHQKVELHDQGWFHAESNRYEQEELAKMHIMTLSSAVADREKQGSLRDGRWVNSPHEFADLGLTGTVLSNALVPFPPNDQQYYIAGKYDPAHSLLAPTAVPNFAHNGVSSSTWLRLVDFAQHADAVHLFDEFSCKTHCGRIYQGSLDNGYFVEALQAISLRPKLVKQLFYAWQTRRSIYIARLFKHGTWMRVEVDDYVPVGRPGRNDADGNLPICCRSEHFPNVIWPSLIEKAYAKIHTLRLSASAISEDDMGGWEAIGGGGKVEDALADLTGGVAGRFYTKDVSPDRLFIYIHDLQRDTLFVCRPNQTLCELQGVRLNPYYPYAVNRAVQWEGGLYYQVFCGGPGVHDGGLQDITVPYTLSHGDMYPEKREDGFFWLNAEDFHEYFGTIFECRLVNSGDVSLPNMPPPRFELVRPPPTELSLMASGMMMPGMMPPEMASGMSPSESADANELQRKGVQHVGPDGAPLAWYEWIFANPGEVVRMNEPEFVVSVPQNAVPCEVVCAIEQFDPRMLMKKPGRPEAVPILCKVYEKVDGENLYSHQLVCRSNWISVRDAMVAFSVTRGGEYLITAELPQETSHVERMIFRCYASQPYVQVAAHRMTRKHYLVESRQLPGAARWSFVGLMEPEGFDKDKPVRLDWEYDAMRKAAFDLDTGWSTLVKEVQEDCVLMLDQAAHQQAKLAYKPAGTLLNKRPGQLSIQSLQDACLVAVVEDLPAVQVPSQCIEVTRVSPDGHLQTVYRVPIPSPCASLSFCYKSSAHLLCSCTEGLQLVFNLYNSETSCAYDNPGVRSISIASDQSLMASAESNFFKVYKVPAPSASNS
ncbi:Calpain-type cysteine protease ADL1 (Phytocalpain ADL1) (Protein ADAXIALIZED LEAF1) (Protein DEFECTIVE KERNEL 1) (OsDEK1) (Protein SHOOTLESS 3) [Durusdinium trenchii]|uniref:Calpain-type cysteine protease ADL1 (Phytocalpain ADL1) (Protein ADAXIALIZED LEAF1) (Protein DEFECTIVE KERNEL 1) (OsDEK1) (Protein SHOOTLESS 3) n=1 Tax=Durusdinium trenchii TaxID=1381693 RepID=A0ABP0N5D2_9DINO